MSRTYRDRNRVIAKKLLDRGNRHIQHLWDPMSSTPSWWVREFMTVPQRARTRQILRRIMKMEDLEEAPFLPHPKKPHVYFW